MHAPTKTCEMLLQWGIALAEDRRADDHGAVISFKAPELCQGADEDLLLVMGEIIFPGFVRRHKGENGLRLWVEGTATDGASRTAAAVQFQTLLGVLRAWRSAAGQLREEQRGGLGQGSARDADGDQWVMVGTAMAYGIVGDEDRTYAESAELAIDTSQNIRNATRSGSTGGPTELLQTST